VNEALAYFAAGFVLGGSAVYLFWVGRVARLEAALRAEREKTRWTEEAKDTLAQAFQLLAAKNLKEANAELLEAAKTLFSDIDRELSSRLAHHTTAVKSLTEPLGDALRRLEEAFMAVEREREGAYRALREQIELLRKEQLALRETTAGLKAALKSERSRGQWGELQLRRVVELAGMAPHVDFAPQVKTERGRPDLLVYLPEGGVIPVDAKAPMNAFLAALEAEDPATREKMQKAHAKALRDRVRELSEKAYWKAFDPAPELVVAFVPSEAALQAALEADPDLLDDALARNVLLASPVTLLALLKSVAYGWRQHALGQEARKVAEAARLVLKRLGPFQRHLGELGKKLEASVTAYNQAVASYQKRIQPLADRLAERLGEALPDPPEVAEGRPSLYGDESSK